MLPLSIQRHYKILEITLEHSKILSYIIPKCVISLPPTPNPPLNEQVYNLNYIYSMNFL